MDTLYKIEIILTPEHSYYLWRILKWTEYDEWVNERFGWSKTPDTAWSDAYYEYTNLLRIEGKYYE